MPIDRLFTREADRRTLHVEHAHVQDSPRLRLMSRAMRGLEALQAAELWAEVDQHHKECMLSGGGPGAGSFWQNIPEGAGYVDNAHWRIAFCMRLGQLRAPPGCQCQLQKHGEGEER
eukprot:9343665-Karenia_brevis.AAC.1